ncbi:hypothetical protein DPMN_124801 [Dreissena polymorpha]|uniref:Uncharacterized protein n=1 Tax=Dreissena polymorpha TaxID=45954 RepID=A0A9D4GSS4_DREPO|nr:hypothetical protein DPMN_124801 [Dreissena polymorpha]
MEVSKDDGTQYAKRAGETVLVVRVVSLWRLDRPYKQRSAREAGRRSSLIISTRFA